MPITDNSSIQLADGFTFTEEWSSDYRIAYGHVKTGTAAVYVSRVDGEESVEVRPQREISMEQITAGQRIMRSLCFSPDGRTAYRLEEQVLALEIATGQVRVLADLPALSPTDWKMDFECSSDDRYLLFTSMAALPPGLGSVMSPPKRLCRIGTDGSDFRILYEDSEEYRLLQVATNWPRGYALLHRVRQTGDHGNELWKLDLETGALTPMTCPEAIGWGLTIHPDSGQVAWWSFCRELCYGVLHGSDIQWKRACEGSGPAWSPDGTTLAFMKDQNRLALLDPATGDITDIAWFDPPGLGNEERRGSYAGTPVWAPDGKSLWFGLTQTRAPISFSPRPAASDPSKQPDHDFRNGFLDLTTKQVWITKGYQHGLEWVAGRERADEPF